MPHPLLAQTRPWEDLLTRAADIGQDAESVVLCGLAAGAVILVGWGLAALVARLLRGLLRGLRFNRALARIVGPRAAARHEPADVAAWGAYWLVLGFALLLALELMGIDVRSPVGERLGEVVPRVVTSAVIFAFGFLVAMVIGGLTQRFLRTAGLRGAKLRGQTVTFVLTAFAALVALEQLGFAAQFVMLVGVVGVSAAGLALALAFGLGCRDLARNFLVEYLGNLDEDAAGKPE